MAAVIILPGEERRLYVQVNGDPAAQGSMDAFPYQRANGKLGVRMTTRKTTKAKLGNWRADVKAAVERVLANEVYADWPGPLDGPLQAVITFTVPKPALPRRVRVGGRMLEAIHYPFRRPDLDKLIRACLDALGTAGVYHDDAQVVGLTCWKVYPGTGSDALPAPGATIRIYQLCTAEPAPAGEVRNLAAALRESLESPPSLFDLAQG